MPSTIRDTSDLGDTEEPYSSSLIAGKKSTSTYPSNSVMPPLVQPTYSKLPVILSPERTNISLLPGDVDTAASILVAMNEIYDEEKKFKVDKNVLVILKKMVRRHIFPKAKFVTHRQTFDRPKKLDQSFAGHVMKSMGWSHLANLEKAVYWNTYRDYVFKEMGQARCTAISSMKKVMVIGK